ncbi:MAG: hypothetical protein RL698_150 [Pseudomonadota bacterium]
MKPQTAERPSTRAGGLSRGGSAGATTTTTTTTTASTAGDSPSHPDAAPDGPEVVEVPIEVGMAGLGRRLDLDWSFAPGLDYVREVVAVGAWLSRARFRLREALPLTSLGIYGPMLNLADVVELRRAEPGPTRLIRRTRPAAVWEVRFARVPGDFVEREAPSRILREFHEAGSSWLLVGESLLVQVPKLPYETMPSLAMTQRIDALNAILRAGRE